MHSRGHAWQGGVYLFAAEGTHPTGMHSYLLFMFFNRI